MHAPSRLHNAQPQASPVVQELQGAGLLATADKPAPRLPTTEDLNELRFLDAVFHEGALS